MSLFLYSFKKGPVKSIKAEYFQDPCIYITFYINDEEDVEIYFIKNPLEEWKINRDIYYNGVIYHYTVKYNLYMGYKIIPHISVGYMTDDDILEKKNYNKDIILGEKYFFYF